MTLFRTLLGGVIAIGLIASPAWADRPRDQDRAFEATRHGRSMPLPQIERRVMPFMEGADYLGPEFRGDKYRLKFMRDLEGAPIFYGHDQDQWAKRSSDGWYK